MLVAGCVSQGDNHYRLNIFNAPVIWNVLPDETHTCLKPASTPRHTHLSLKIPLVVYLVFGIFSGHRYSTWWNVVVLLCIWIPLVKGTLSPIKV